MRTLHIAAALLVSTATLAEPLPIGSAQIICKPHETLVARNGVLACDRDRNAVINPLDINKPVQTRNGLKARIVAKLAGAEHDFRFGAGDHSILAVVTFPKIGNYGPTDVEMRVYEDGRWQTHDTETGKEIKQNPFDLINVK